VNPQGSSRYWRRLRRLTGVLLALWAAITLAGPWYARELSTVEVFGFPLGFWLASQGSLLLYIGIIAAYALLADRLEERALAGAEGATEAEAAGKGGPP
jgi:putative solute:sodium symporter small subunit